LAYLAALGAIAEALVRETHRRFASPCVRGKPLLACVDSLLAKGGARADYEVGPDSTVTVCFRVTPAAFEVIHQCEVDACGTR
jgi:hypothetical protein